VIARSSRQSPGRWIPFIAAAFLLGLAGLVSLKVWVLAHMLVGYLF
jgi:hypothetical protein